MKDTAFSSLGSTPELSGDQLADPLHYSSATALAQAIRKKEVSSEEIVRIFLERIEEVNPKLNAVVQLAADEALAAAREMDITLARDQPTGPLHGVPITLKDSIDTAGLISTGGTLGRARHVPDKDATVAARLRAAGAIVLGKTNTPELTLSYNTNNLVYGQTFNPYDLSRSPGGSSGGAAAILAVGGAALDIGSDTGGSIRYPSHCCGIAGIKPTAGRVPRTGHIWPFGGIIDSFTQLGPMSRYVEDLILTLPLIMGPDWRDPAIVSAPPGDPRALKLGGLRVSFQTGFGKGLPTPETAETVRRAAAALADAGLIVEEDRPTGIEETSELYHDLLWADGGERVRTLLERGRTTRYSLTWLDNLKPHLMAELCDAMDRWDAFRSRMIQFMENYDVILSPVHGMPALPVDGEFLDFSYTQMHNLTGWPGAVVRGGTSPEGLPIGVQIVARPWREDVALAVAKHLEMVLGGFQPPRDL